MLSAPGEGLVAKIDLLETQPGIAIPIDYKRGRVPDVPGNAWEPEQVQLCAQGLILRECGYLCEGGILYFIESRRRVSVPFEDPLVDRTRELIVEMRAAAAAGAIPPPLVDSPKCPRCSLVGICLPDEIGLLRAEPEPADDGKPATKPRVRRLLPACDEALPLYLQQQGTSLGKTGDQLVVKARQEVMQKVKLIDVSQVCVFGNVQVTSQALRELATAGIPLCYFTYGGWYFATMVGHTHKNVELRIAQYAAASDPGRSLAFARQFVAGKIKNARTLLRRHLDGSANGILDALSDLAAKLPRANNLGTLLGIEGTAAKVYFGGFGQLLKGEYPFDFDGRNRRPPRDPVNALLSFVYALLVKELAVALQAVGFGPMLGFYPQPRYGRTSLALDLAEEFRPLVADSVVLTLINNGEVSPASFVSRAGAVALTDAGRRAVLAGFERRMETLVTHPIFGYRVSYRRVLEVQSRLLARTLLGEIDEYPSFCTR
jgi:CRISPR-associated protein Cas1